MFCTGQLLARMLQIRFTQPKAISQAGKDVIYSVNQLFINY
jgi:hypothetical protein